MKTLLVVLRTKYKGCEEGGSTPLFSDELNLLNRLNLSSTPLGDRVCRKRTGSV